MDRDRRDIADRFHVPDPAEQFFLAEYMVGILGQECQKIKFLGRKVLLNAVNIYSSGRLVNLQAADLHDIIGPGIGTDQALIAGHMGLYPGNQLTGAEGLGHVVVSAQAKAADLIDVILFGRHHQDRNIFGFPDLAAYFKAVNTGKHKIQDDQIEIFIQGRLQAAVAPGLCLHFES